MVVLVLIGIIFSFAVLSLGRNDLAEAMERETRRLVTLIDMANDEAVIRGEELAIHFTDNGYAFLVLQLEGWGELQDDQLLKSYKLPAGISAGSRSKGIRRLWVNRRRKPRTVRPRRSTSSQAAR
jgi:general secretion pathway protein H